MTQDLSFFQQLIVFKESRILFETPENNNLLAFLVNKKRLLECFAIGCL